MIFNFVYNTFLIAPIYLLMGLFKILNPKIAIREKNWLPLLKELPKKAIHIKRIWFHVASMGEFEQAKPIIEYLKKNYYGLEIITTFYSPSGLENQKDYPLVDYMLYMPFDFKPFARLLIEKISPSVAVFIRYDLWYNHLSILKEQRIPIMLVCATKSNSQIFNNNSLIGSIYINSLRKLDYIYTAGKDHSKYFRGLELDAKIINSHDTRFDRVIKKVNENSFSDKSLTEFTKDKIVLVAGSTWKEDENLLFEFYDNVKPKVGSLFLIIVPHEPTTENIKRIMNKRKDVILYSEYEKTDNDLNNKILLIDSIGKLLSLYSLANYAYVGGGFSGGLHSIIEPVGYGLPTFFGTNYSKSSDAKYLIDKKTVFTVADSDILGDIFLKIYKKQELYSEIHDKNSAYVFSANGESVKIAKDIMQIVEKKLN